MSISLLFSIILKFSICLFGGFCKEWFSWDNIHQCELRFLPEFFDGRSPSKNPKVYKYCRNSIIQRYRENSSRKITFTEVRKTIIGDVGAIRRVFDFLEAWGLINYTASASKLSQHKLEDKEAKSTTIPTAQGADSAASGTASADSATPKKWFCGACKSPCAIACFSCDKVIQSLYKMKTIILSYNVIIDIAVLSTWIDLMYLNPNIQYVFRVVLELSLKMKTIWLLPKIFTCILLILCSMI